MKIRPLLYIPVFYLAAIMPRMFGRPDVSSLMGYHYAHRGLHDNDGDAPENSLPAFKKAVEAGYGIEFDVQLTKDHIPVVFHDESLKRVCGVNKNVRDLTYDELQALSLFHSSEKIPTLKEVLTLVDGQVPLIIEIKVYASPSDVCIYSDALISSYNGVYCVESFHPLALRWYKIHRPDVIRGQLSSNFKDEKNVESPERSLVHHLLTNFLCRPDFIAYDHKYKSNLSRCICRYLFGSLSVSWTIRSQDELDACKDDFDLFIFERFEPEQ